MSRVGLQAYKALQEIVQACEKYRECDRCGLEHCPMATYCIEENPLTTIAYDVPKQDIIEFINGADELTTYYSTEAEYIENAKAEEANLLISDPEEKE